jgi:hypothetical protein
MDEPLIYCPRCEQDKPESAFAFCAHRGLQRWCRACKTEYTRKRRQHLREHGVGYPPVGSGITQAEWREYRAPERQRVRDMYGLAD